MKEMTSKRNLMSVLLVLALTAGVPSNYALARFQEGAKAREQVERKVIPFALTDVRLLDGPFRDAMLRNQTVLLGFDNNRLLHTWRINAGLPSSDSAYGGWEAPNVELRGHTLGHVLTACALMYASTGDERFKAKADSLVVELAEIQKALPSRGFNPGYLSAFPEEFIDRVESRKPVWAPYYTLHKIMAGLLDMYVHCGNATSLGLVTEMAAWVKGRMDKLTTEQQQKMLQTEFGGMNDVLANLYAVTGDPDHLRLARLFDHDAVFGPLSRGADSLDGLHGNTQIPKMIGAVREYQLTGEKRYYDIARFFWERVVRHRSYVIGGNTNDEHFFRVDLFSKNLGSASTETCNSYNMLKLTRDLFALNPEPEFMEFYERTLFNHILASQDPATGMMCYYVPMKPGAFKTFSTPDKSFWCCVGTGVENHAKYGESVFFHDDQSLYLNLFLASELRWKEKGLSVRLETRFPEEDNARLIFTCDKPVRMKLVLRHPRWVASPMKLMVNGKNQPVRGKSGSFETVDRTWKSGDIVEIRWPMNLRQEAMAGEPNLVSVLYGPIVLAGDLGTEGLDDAKRFGPSAPPMRRVKPIVVPDFVTGKKNLLSTISAVKGEPLTFRTSNLGKPDDVTLIPFYKVNDRRYSVYWRTFTGTQWAARKTEIAWLEARKQTIEQSTVDVVDIDNRESERAHGFAGERSREHWFDDRRGRESRTSFSYALKILPDEPMYLVCTYRGSEGPKRAFEVLIDETKIAEQTLEIHPGEFFDFEYRLPEELTRGKQSVTITFLAKPEAIAGAVFEVRTVRLK